MDKTSRNTGLRCFVIAVSWSALALAVPQDGIAQKAPEDILVQEYDFVRIGGGRPQDVYVLKYARDEDVCRSFLAAMNEPRAYSDNWKRNDIHAVNDVFLGSRYTVSWTAAGPTPSWYSNVDINNDGTLDHVYLKTWSATNNAYEVLFFTSTPPANASDLGAALLEVQRQSSAQIILEGRTIDFGGGQPAGDDPNWSLGQFKNVAIIDGRSYVVTGGNWQRLLERDWFPVRLIDVHDHAAHRLTCELFPKFRQEWPPELGSE